MTRPCVPHDRSFPQHIDAELFSRLPTMIWSTRADGYLDYANDRYLEHVGLTLEQASGWGWKDAVHPADVDGLVAYWEKLIATGDDGQYQFRLGNPQKGYRWSISLAAAYRDAQGHLIRWYGSTLDIEDRHQAADRLEEARAELAHVSRISTMGQLTASVAHEVSQPLAAIVVNGGACLRWLQRADIDMNEVHATVKRMVASARRAASIVDNLHALARREPPKQALLDLNTLVEETIAIVRGELTRSVTVLELELDRNIPRVAADRVQVQQVLINIVNNAMQAMACIGDRRLWISSRLLEEGRLLICVKDNGPGLPHDDPESLFTPFFSTKRTGMGMGLSICRTIMEQHGGSIFASNNADRGASFHITLPVAE